MVHHNLHHQLEKLPPTLIVRTITFERVEMETRSLANLKERKKPFLKRTKLFNFRLFRLLLGPYEVDCSD